VPTKENFLSNLPDDKETLKAMLRSLWQEREHLEKRAEEQQRKIEEQRQRADELYLEKLRLQVELERYKKATYGPRADRLRMNQLAQMLLEFADALEQKPINLEDLRQVEAEPEVRRVKRRKARGGVPWPTSKIFRSTPTYTS
jgi:predicted nuclease with TOPRIM domain